MITSKGFVIVDLDREHGAFYAGFDHIESGFCGMSPFKPSGDIDGQWEHTTDNQGEESGFRSGWECNYSVFENRQTALNWASRFLRCVNPITKQPFRFMVLSLKNWDKQLTHNLNQLKRETF